MQQESSIFLDLDSDMEGKVSLENNNGPTVPRNTSANKKFRLLEDDDDEVIAKPGRPSCKLI